jgi:hypothetical protein
MSDFQRFLAASGGSNVRALLEAGLADAPRPDALPRVAAALGLASAVVVAAPAAASGGAVGAALAAAKAPLGGATTVLALSKWLLAGVVSGVLVTSTAAVVERTRARVDGGGVSPPSRGPARSPQQARSGGRAPALARSPWVSAPAADATASFPALSTDADTTLAPAAPTGHGLVPASRAAAGAPGGSVSDSVGAEAARVDAARRALAAGDLGRALSELDAYQRIRTVGVLDREALLLRIQVLVQRGERERAVGLARNYLAAHPRDAHATRLWALVANGGTVWPSLEGIDR